MREQASHWHTSASSSPPQDAALPERAEVVVVGAGMMGVGLARTLVEAGADVVLLDAEAPGQGATGRGAGMVDVGTEQQLAELARRIGLEGATQLYAASHENLLLLRAFIAEHCPAALLPSAGILSMWTDDDEAHTWTASREGVEALGHPVELLDRSGCEAVMGGALCEEIDGGALRPSSLLVQPLDYLYAALRSAQARGCVISYGARVTGLRAQRRGFVVETSLGQVEARAVVLANNVGLVEHAPKLAAVLRYVSDVAALVEVTPRAPQPVGWGVHWGQTFGCHLGGGRLLFGGFATRPEVAVAARRGESLGELSLAEGVRCLSGVYRGPRLTRIERCWSGVVAYAVDELPIIGAYPEVPGLWVLGAFGGQGLPFAMVGPRWLARAIERGSEEPIPAALRPARFPLT